MNLDREHKVLANLLNEVGTVLRGNSIQYFLIGGSAIGAVRDRKIIPWDDDIDIGIRREDFDAAIDTIKNANLDHTRLYIPSQNNSYDLTFAKVVHSVPGMNLFEQGTGIAGAYIDIFPLDHTASFKAFRRFQQLQYRIGHALVVAKKSPEELGRRWGKIGGALLKLYVSKLSYKKVYKKRDVFITTGKMFKNSGVFYNFGTAYKYDKEIYYASEINSFKFVQFEGGRQPVPKGVNSILTRTYGNYMEAPVNKKQKHLKSF